jgi:hypothetical protein
MGSLVHFLQPRSTVILWFESVLRLNLQFLPSFHLLLMPGLEIFLIHFQLNENARDVGLLS